MSSEKPIVARSVGVDEDQISEAMGLFKDEIEPKKLMVIGAVYDFRKAMAA